MARLAFTTKPEANEYAAMQREKGKTVTVVYLKDEGWVVEDAYETRSGRDARLELEEHKKSKASGINIEPKTGGFSATRIRRGVSESEVAGGDGVVAGRATGYRLTEDHQSPT